VLEKALFACSSITTFDHLLRQKMAGMINNSDMLALKGYITAADGAQ